MTLQLDDRQRALLAEMGIKLWLPKAAPATPEIVASGADSTGAEARSDAESAQSASAVAPATRAPAAPSAPRVRPAAPPQSAAPEPQSAMVLGPRPEGVADMDWPQLEAAVAACRACGLCAGRTQTVFGVGARSADWMVIGEAPGENEDRQGQPFVGQAGKLLDAMLAAIGLSRQSDDAPESIISSTWRDSPMAASMLSSNLPAWPTKGWPWRSSFSPGASPITIQSAVRLPTPNTVCVRPAHRPQARQAATVASSCGQSMSATPSGRGPSAVGTGAAGAVGSGAAMARTGGRTMGAAAGGCRLAAGVGFESNSAPALVSPARAASFSGAMPATRGALGAHSLMPISASMARWRSSNTRLMRRPPAAGS